MVRSQWLWQVASALVGLVIAFVLLLWNGLLTFGLWLLAAIILTATAWFTLWPWLGGLLALARLRAATGQQSNEQIMLGWYEMERAFARIGYRRAQAKTVDEYGQQVGDLFPDSMDRITLLGEAFQQVRYAPLDRSGNRIGSDLPIDLIRHQASELIRLTMRLEWPWHRWLTKNQRDL